MTVTDYADTSNAASGPTSRKRMRKEEEEEEEEEGEPATSSATGLLKLCFIFCYIF